MSSVSTPFAPVAAIPAVLVAVRAMNSSGIVPVLDEATTHHGLDAILDEVVFPALRVVGTFWADGSLDVAHEHLLSSAVTRWAYAQLQRQHVRRQGWILLAAGRENLDVLGPDCLELLLADRGAEVCNLGRQIPPTSLVVAARQADATAVVVCSHNPSSPSRPSNAVRAVHAAGFPVYYAGSSFESQFVRQHFPGDALDAPLSVSAGLLTSRHTVAVTHAAPSLPRTVAEVSA